MFYHFLIQHMRPRFDRIFSYSVAFGLGAVAAVVDWELGDREFIGPSIAFVISLMLLLAYLDLQTNVRVPVLGTD